MMMYLLLCGLIIKFNWYPLVICYIAIEHGHRIRVSFPIKNGGYFHSYVAVYQRVTINVWSILYPVFLYAIL